MKSLFEQMGGTYRQEGDYLIPNLYLPDEPDYQIGKYGRMRRSYLKAHRPVLYANYLTSGTLHQHLAEIDQACNERMEIIVSAMPRPGPAWTRSGGRWTTSSPTALPPASRTTCWGRCPNRMPSPTSWRESASGAGSSIISSDTTMKMRSSGKNMCCCTSRSYG